MKGQISLDLSSLAEKIANQKVVVIDGYVGVFFEDFRKKLDVVLKKSGKKIAWTNIETAMIGEDRINQLTQPFMGDSDSIFGTRATIDFSDYFDSGKLHDLTRDNAADINIVYGAGASLSGWNGLLVYIDLPKNELQFRARARSIKNLGGSQSSDMKTMYKRFYFIDWVLLNKAQEEDPE